MIIAIDGPAATGKSTTAKCVAQKLGFIYLDTGAMYRSVTLAILNEGIDINNSSRLKELLSGIDIDMRMMKGTIKFYLNGKDVSNEIRTPKITRNVSAVSALKEVRLAMVQNQRKLAKKIDCVIEGRDIGTVVFPDAEFKFFMKADLHVRAERRLKELHMLGEEKSIEELMKDIKHRDEYDSSRNISPLKKAEDAIVIDTTFLSIDEQVSRIIEIVNNQ
ncbi:MAG: (d)CMP kinase [Fidelibacterota bacterium]